MWLFLKTLCGCFTNNTWSTVQLSYRSCGRSPTAYQTKSSRQPKRFSQYLFMSNIRTEEKLSWPKKASVSWHCLAFFPIFNCPVSQSCAPCSLRFLFQREAWCGVLLRKLFHLNSGLVCSNMILWSLVKDDWLTIVFLSAWPCLFISLGPHSVTRHFKQNPSQDCFCLLTVS